MEDLIKVTIQNVNALNLGNVKMVVELTSNRAVEGERWEKVSGSSTPTYLIPWVVTQYV